MPLLEILSSSFGDEIRLQLCIHLGHNAQNFTSDDCWDIDVWLSATNIYILQRPNNTINTFFFQDHKASVRPSQPFEVTLFGFYSMFS